VTNEVLAYCIPFNGVYGADRSGPRGCANATATAAARSRSARKAATSRLRVDSGIPTLERSAIPVGSGTLGSSAAARRGLGAAALDTTRKRLAVSPRALAVSGRF